MERTGTITASDRRQRFRSFMKWFNPTAPPKAAIGEGLIYRDPQRSIFKELAVGADLDPGSQQLVVGGIGSGKTTELLLAEREIAAHEQTLTVYVDVSAETDLSAINSGSLLASLGLTLWKIIESRFSQAEIDSWALRDAAQAVEKAAYGHEKQVWVPDFDDYDSWEQEPDDHEVEPEDYEPGHYRTVKVPGKLRQRFPAFQRDVKDLAKSLGNLTTFLKNVSLEIVAIFDGLDRLINADQFWAVAEQDLRAMRPLEISLLVAGPLSVMYGQGRQIKDYFNEVRYLPPVIADPKHSPFLLEVLRLRGAHELMEEKLMQKLCLASGGVLRDLISLARSAGENAYLEDADTIQTKHADRAIEQLGNSYLLGLGSRQKETVQAVLGGEGFAQSNPENMELLITRRILEQPESSYEVHPALASVLMQTSSSSE